MVMRADSDPRHPSVLLFPSPLTNLEDLLWETVAVFALLVIPKMIPLAQDPYPAGKSPLADPARQAEQTSRIVDTGSSAARSWPHNADIAGQLLHQRMDTLKTYQENLHYVGQYGLLSISYDTLACLLYRKKSRQAG